MTATSSCGLGTVCGKNYMLQHQIDCRSYLPLSIVHCQDRSTSTADHSDSMGARDAGWIQIYAESNQEAYDNFLQAFRIAEHKDVMLPVMICQDGFITSHGVENIRVSGG